MSRFSRTNKKHFITLNLKLAIVVVIALIMTLLVFELLSWVQGIIINRYYLSEEAIEKNENEIFDDFVKFIDRQHIKSTDTEQLQRWVRDREYVYLIVSDNYSIAFDGGWSVSSGAVSTEDITTDQSNVTFDNENDRITPDTFIQDTKNRILQFEDGLYYVFINVYREEYFNRVMMFAKIILCVLTLIGTIMIYNGSVLGRISRLSADVEEVTRGNLTGNIESTANDEIGRLANNVDSMRNYIIKRLRSEKEAWDKNSELITAMSHDIRTPLTSLIGYLDIIESGKYQSKEEETRYIEACREKAFQLKDLSDKLFQYFLVFGSQGPDRNTEVYDAGILFQQIISEHSAELINYGFNIELDYTIPEEMEIKADISALRRLFDNLFSNIMKYADKNSPIKISANVDEKNNMLIVGMKNHVLVESRRVESNKIGLKTCEKICNDLGGSFETLDEEQTFTVNLSLPVFEEARQDAIDISEEASLDIHDINIHNMEEVLGEASTSEEGTVEE